jgi:hypothetical protein
MTCSIAMLNLVTPFYYFAFMLHATNGRTARRGRGPQLSGRSRASVCCEVYELASLLSIHVIDSSVARGEEELPSRHPAKYDASRRLSLVQPLDQAWTEYNLGGMGECKVSWLELARTQPWINYSMPRSQIGSL